MGNAFAYRSVNILRARDGEDAGRPINIHADDGTRITYLPVHEYLYPFRWANKTKLYPPRTHRAPAENGIFVSFLPTPPIRSRPPIRPPRVPRVVLKHCWCSVYYFAYGFAIQECILPSGVQHQTKDKWQSHESSEPARVTATTPLPTN